VPDAVIPHLADLKALFDQDNAMLLPKSRWPGVMRLELPWMPPLHHTFPGTT